MHSKNLSTLVRNVCDGTFSHCELLQFVDLSQKIAVSYLKYQEVTGKNISFDKRGAYNNLSDVAMDCIATLFMRNDHGKFVQLEKYFAGMWNHARPLDDEEILMKLRGLIIKKTKQELSRIFRERDPEGAKILRNVRVALKSTSDLSSFKEMGREFVYSVLLATSMDYNPEIILKRNPLGTPVNPGLSFQSLEHRFPNLRRDLPAIPERVLRQRFLSHYSPKDPVSIIVRKMLWIVGQYAEYQNFLGLDVVVNNIRLVNTELFQERLLAGSWCESPIDYLRQQEIEAAMLETMDYISKKIEKHYVEKNKVIPEKAQAYRSTLMDLVTDLANGKNPESNFSYLRRYLPLMTQHQYREEERSIFEYLVKLAKNMLIRKLQTLL
ncbi:hypothetical protein L0128_01405 [candidate division KSB1 bacterium]|nr:hypothetical protein [candidate division KSB1 bacterium]